MRKKVVLVLLCIFVIFTVLNCFMLIVFSMDKPFVTGRITSGILSLFIEGGERNIYIYNPENITYNFNIGDNYTLDLNCSDDFDVDIWTYTLEDLRHSITPYLNIGFNPNTTFNAVRWQNKLTVSGEDSSGNSASKSVVFYVSVPNSAPNISGVDSEIYVCEGDDLSSYFNVTDVDEDDLTSDVSPKNPFYTFPVFWHADGLTFTSFEIISGTLDKSHVDGINSGWKVYEETVSVHDGEYADYAYTNITVIEINNAPDVANIGVQTVQTKGDNSTFYKQVQVKDVEDGDQDSGNFGFNITILNSSGDSVNLFDITQNGIMNFTPSSSQVGVYDISVCVNDTGIDNPFDGILGNCSQDGGEISVCQDFVLTVTDENRAPTITNYYPANLSLNVSGTDVLNFNITEYDPDETFPDAYWYVDDVLKEYDSGSLVDEFSYSFGCGVSGEHVIKVDITDGLLNDSIEWGVNVGLVVCPVGVSPSGGGGGCSVLWSCDDWETCQSAEKSLRMGILSGEDYRIIREKCLENGLSDAECGFQIRDCFDLNSCNISWNKPVGVQSCYYIGIPSCSDGIKNCHDDACELLVDCGGPCLPCSSCSDGIQNQGEDDIDCGGPCPICVEVPKKVLDLTKWVFVLVLMFLMIMIVIVLIKIIIARRRLKKRKNG